MTLKFLSPQAAMKLLELAEKKTPRPPEIVRLKEEIEAKTRLAEFRASYTGVVDQNLVHEIVQMKLRLDALYGEWAEKEAGVSFLS